MLRAVSAIPSLIPARCRGETTLWLAPCLPQCCSGLWPAIRFSVSISSQPSCSPGFLPTRLRSRESRREPVPPFHTIRERVPRPTDGRARDRPSGAPGGRLGHGGLCAEPACPSRAHLNGPASMDFDVNYIKQCVAPGVEPAAIEAIINETSGYNELAVKVVSKDGRKAVVVRQPTTVAAMTETVSSSVKTGADVRFGLGLIPARLLPELKVSVAQATEPCTNLRIASLIYLRARQMVAATSRNPRDLALETRMAYLAGSHHGTPIEGLTPAGPVVVPEAPPRDVEGGEGAAAARSPGEPRRLAQGASRTAACSKMPARSSNSR